ncbi:unnamed protein product [Paramecium primaurelia]|uniref:Tetratricopeptide repeat protein n=1 Tax=Paramecium primaurelia TaxID=5886 RepID=A0A8S1Q717_PARPR|nr:unnamed protein product [Paramecium primaurelia]
MDTCQKVHHQNNKIIGICQLCKQSYLSCNLCFAEIHYKHNDDFLIIDNILLIVEQVLQKIEMAKQYMAFKNLITNQQFNSFIQTKYTSLQIVKSHLINQNLQKLLTFEFLTTINQDFILQEILNQLILQSQFFNDEQINNIKQIFDNLFQEVQEEHLIILMFDKSCLLYSIQKYEEAFQVYNTLLKLTQKKYFITKNIQDFSQGIILKSTNTKWKLECLFGRNLYIIKEYKKSLDFFKKLSDNNKDQQILKESYIYISLNLIQMNKYEEALNYLSIYNQIDPMNLIINFFQGFALERFGKLELALEKYKLISQKTNDSFYNLLYGKILLNCNKFKQANELFEKILQHRNFTEIIQIYKCLILLNESQMELALKQSEMLIDTNKNSVYGYLLKGIILQMQDKTQEVNIISDQIDQYFPNNSWNYFFQSYILTLDNKFEQAQIYLDNIQGVNHDLLFLKALFLLRLNKIQDAFDIIQQLNKEDYYCAVLKEAFFIIKENDQTNIGIQQFKRLFEINPKDYLAMHYQGFCFYIELKYDQAIQCFNEAIKINSKLFESYFLKGESLFKKLQFQDALDCYINASKCEEFDNEKVNFHKGNIYLFLLKFDKAIIAYEDAKSIDLASIMKAIIDWYKKKNQEALVEAEKKKDKYKELFFMLGRLYNEFNNKQFTQYHIEQFKKINEEGINNFHKGNYQNGKVFIKYMERNFKSFEQLPDREYEILKYAAWFLDLHTKEINLYKVQWKFPKFFYQSIKIIQNKIINEEQLKYIGKYPVI